MENILPNENGIYYFLGNITSHIMHALPLQKELGGTFVVMSDRARREVERYNVPVINLNNRPYKLTRWGYKVKPYYHYIHLDKSHKKTFDYLNEFAKIILVYELFDFSAVGKFNNAKLLFLTHGNMLKSYMTMYPKRLEIIKQYDGMAAVGPFLKNRLINEGVSADRLLDIGIARTDELYNLAHNPQRYANLKRKLRIPVKQKTILYAPTFWGASSIYTTGLRLLKNIPDNYVVLFRPHPETPRKILAKYDRILDSKSNIIPLYYADQDSPSLPELLTGSDAVLIDLSSVTLEALLVDTPLIFVYDNANHRQNPQDYAAISDIVRYSYCIDSTNVEESGAIISSAIDQGVNNKLWSKTKKHCFFDSEGGSTKTIVDLVQKLR